MRIDDIDALLATVQFSSLNQAAEYLGITQSAITRRLQRLEQELNVTLLERQTRPLTLTAAGHRVYEQCLSIKRETKKLYSLLDPQGEPRGALRLGVPQSLSEIALPAALSALSQQFPGLSPQITCGWSGQLQRRLENGELDGMLAMGPAQQSRRGLQRAPAVSPGGGADRRPAFEFARVIPAGVRRTGLDP